MISDVVLPAQTASISPIASASSVPNCPCSLVSGFTPTRRDITDADGAQYPFLQKPFTARALLHRARDLLDGTSDASVSTVA